MAGRERDRIAVDRRRLVLISAQITHDADRTIRLARLARGVAGIAQGLLLGQQRHHGVGLFEQLFLIRTLPPWFTNELKRLIKTPKLYFLDSGLLASLRGLTPARIAADRGPFGALLETFVLAEALKLASWSDDGPFEFFHFRDKEQNEVDVVIESPDGKLIGLEVKAAASVTSSDFGGLRKLAEASGKRFAAGFVLYDHTQTVPFGDRLFAVPISSLWS